MLNFSGHPADISQALCVQHSPKVESQGLKLSHAASVLILLKNFDVIVGPVEWLTDKHLMARENYIQSR